MLFKNASVYRLTSPLTHSAEELIACLENQAFVPCSGIRPSSFGWIPPIPYTEDAPLAHEVAGSILLCARREDKVIPPSALREAIAEQVARLESLEGRKVRNREKLNIKDDAMAELLPRALPRSKQIMGYITPADNLLVIDTPNAAEAELFINCLRDSLGTLNLVPPQVRYKPSDIFSRWLMTRKLPDHFGLGDSCDLIDIETGSTVSCRKQDLDTAEIRNHLEAGKLCTKLGLRWHGDFRVTVDKELILRQLKTESSDDEANDEDNPIARLDAEFVNLSLELGRFLPALFAAMGGEGQSADA
ncbi:MAG: recombination-associated protein RdgC [Pseudomonadales bacterium]|nr:recombination-associated protein RdgC [Pseudomonadales bacterium]